MSKTIKYFKRLPNGGLESRHMVLDSSDILIADYEPSETSIASENAEVLAKYPHLAAQIARGSKFRLQEDGSILVLFVPESEKMAYKFFSGGEVSFPGWQALREEFEKKKADLGSNCADCSLGQLVRDMTPAVVEAINKADGL